MEAIEELERRRDNERLLLDRRNTVSQSLFDDAIALCRSLQQQLAYQSNKVRELTTMLDDQHGTPCEQIRHQQEVEELREQLAAKSAEAARMRSACELVVKEHRDTQQYAVSSGCDVMIAASPGTTACIDAITTAEGGKSNHDSTGTR